MFFAQNITQVVTQRDYGYLYNGYAVSHVNFATSGWHVPSKTELETLTSYLITNGYNYDGTTTGDKIAKSLATTVNWRISSVTGAVGNTDYPLYRNKTGLSYVPAGYRQSGLFGNSVDVAVIWSATDVSTDIKYYLYMYHDGVNTYIGNNGYYQNGHSVRLIKDSTSLSDGETSTMTDYDGNTYDTICIGTQEWTVQNWKCTKLNNGTALTKVTSDATWVAATTGNYYYCAYNNDESNV